ncbi:MAG: phytanoyl-CoA dioxygenase family protein [Myxococcota bacterium]
MQPVVPRLRTELTRFARRLPAWTRAGPPLVVAAARGDAARVATLLEAGHALDARNGHGQTALHVAARCSRAEIAALLLARGASHVPRDALGRRPLDPANVDPETLHAIRQLHRRTPLLPDDPRADALTAADGMPALEGLRRDGLVKLPGLVPPALLEAMQREFAAFVATIDRRRAGGGGEKRGYDEEEHWWAQDLAYVSNNAFKHSPALTRFFCDPRLTALARSYYGRHAFITRGVAMRYLPLEARDTDMFRWHHDLEDRRLKALVLLTDVPPEGQAMRYALGSHGLRHPHRAFFRNAADLAAYERRRGRVSIVETTGRAGDVFFFDSNGIHRGQRRPDAPVRDTFFVEYGIDTSNIWGGDPAREVLDRFAAPDGAPFAELCAAERKWLRPMTRRHPSWIENLYDVDAWRPAGEARCAGDGPEPA